MMRHVDKTLLIVTLSVLVYYAFTYDGALYFWLSLPMAGVWFVSLILSGSPARWCEPIIDRRGMCIAVGSAAWHATLTTLLTLHVVLVGVDHTLYPPAIAAIFIAYRVTVPQVCRVVCHALHLPLPRI